MRVLKCVGLAILLHCGSSLRLCAGENKWTAMGPYGGYVAKFAFHPRLANIVFASAKSSLYLSRDAGRKWKWVAELGAEATVCFDPLNDSRVLVGAYGLLFSSSDFGKSWEQVTIERLPDWISDLEFDPSDSKTLYAVLRYAGVYKSTDGGITWSARNKGLDLSYDAPCCSRPQLEVDPTDGDTVYVLLPSRKIFKSTDGCVSWKNVSKGFDMSGDITDLVVNPQDPGTLYAGGEGGIFKSTSSGDAWTEVNGEGSYDLSIDRRNPSTLYSMQSLMVLKTTDGGATWTELIVDNHTAKSVAVHPLRRSLVFVGGVDQGIYRSADGGATWEPSNSGLEANTVTRIIRRAKSSPTLFALASLELQQSEDNGATWHPSSLVGDGTNQVRVLHIQVHPADPRLIMTLGGRFGAPPALAVSKDAGRSWATGSAFKGAGGSQGPIALDPVDLQTVFFAPWRGDPVEGMGVAKTKDEGRTWSYANTGLSSRDISALAADPQSDSVLFAGTDASRDGGTAKIFRSTNSGGTWKDCSTGIGAAEVTGFGFTDTAVFASTLGGVYKSTDGGRTWALKTQPSIFGSIALHPTNPRTLLACGVGGLLISTDEGETWSAFESVGLGPFAVNDVIVDPASPNTFLIGTDHGVFSYTRASEGEGPEIIQLIPASGKAGDTVVINGSGFGQLQGDSRVRFGALDAGSSQTWSDTSVKMIVPSGVRTGPVKVSVLGKTSNPFEFIVLPTTGNVEPTSGPAAGGTRVTILTPSGATSVEYRVHFGSALARGVRFTQPNIITCDSPPGTGTVDVTLSGLTKAAKVGTFRYE